MRTVVSVALLTSTLSLALPATALADPYGDLTCDGDVDVIDAVLAIRLAVGLGIHEEMDTDGDGIPDACPIPGPPLNCGDGTEINAAGDACMISQAALDAASHIVSDGHLGEPRTNRELFNLLEGASWIDAPLAAALRNMAGLRNILVHGYDTVDLAIVRDVVEQHLDELLEFVAAVRQRLS